MTELKFEKILLKSVNIGELNPMPDLKNISYIHAKCETTENVTEEEKKHFWKGKIDTILPYLSQDGYDRDLKETEYDCAILENEYLKAVFLPSLGGRLWSLYHKKMKKELLYVNDIVQPGNLGLRNAWVAGGVEWNIGVKGHSPFTSDKLFACESVNEKGEKFLSMYEYERIRKVVFGINAYLPDDDDKLYIRTTVENKSDNSPYMYWWSNIAVSEKETRIFTDADEMFTCIYEDNHYVIDKAKAPDFKGVDISYPERAPHAGDVFFKTSDNERKWIASVDKSGTGLLQYSTPQLIGRKAFFWGKGKGGENWNKFLTGSENKYIEIQAGLLCTQQEHIEMPKNTTWCWTECYTLLNLEKEKIEGDWKETCSYISEYVKSLPNPLDAPVDLFAKKKIMSSGSGWGAVTGKKISDYYEFPLDSVGTEEAKWLHLTDKGYLKEEDVQIPPLSYMNDEKILDLLIKSTDNEKGDHWLTYLHIGMIYYIKKEYEKAQQNWKKSIEKKENPWAYRNLSMYCKNFKDDKDAALMYILKSIGVLKNECRGLYTDVASVLTDCKEYKKWIDIYDSLSDSLKSMGRFKIYTAICYMGIGKDEKAKELINEDFSMADIKEGELSITKVWNDLYKGEKELPAHLNFRMFEE